LIYLDTSVVLARLFAEDRSPPDAFWSQALVASRLLEYELFNRIHARAAQATRGAAARQLVDRANLLELSAEVLSRALLPFAQRGAHAGRVSPGDEGLLAQPRLVDRAGNLRPALGGGGRQRGFCAGRLLTADGQRGLPPYQCTPLNTCANSLRARSTGDLGSAAISAAACASLKPRAAAESGNNR